MKIQEFFIAQLRNMKRVTAGILAVTGIREQSLLGHTV